MTTTEPPLGTTAAARRITRAFLVCHALRWLPVGFILPILVLVPTERGIALPTVGLMFATYGLTTALLELPTGGLADAVGRKPVLLVATVADSGLLLALAFGSTASHFLAGAALGGVGRALLSGPLESWYVDTVRTVDPTVALRPGLARAGFAEGVALALGALLSAVLPTVGAGLARDDGVGAVADPAGRQRDRERRPDAGGRRGGHPGRLGRRCRRPRRRRGAARVDRRSVSAYAVG